MCLSGDRDFNPTGVSCPSYPLSSKMLTLHQVSLLFAKSACRAADDDNNNSNSLGCGALALKMMSARATRLLPRSGAPRRCLFGAPASVDTQRLLREDLDAAKARMSRRWGWDVSKDKPSASSSWDWETVKNRRHPYHPPGKRVETPNLSSMTSVPTPLTPLPDTPKTVTDTSPASTSSSSGTSTLSASPVFPEEVWSSSPTLENSCLWSLESDECDSDCSSTDSALSSHTTSSTSSESVTEVHTVQTRLTDFWRSRRCSISDGGKGIPVAPTGRTATRTCSV